MNDIGIRQGRLSPWSSGPVQRFPWLTWKDEFARARGCGLAFIDWLLPADDWERNPIWSGSGQHDIRAAMATTGVTVPSLCADYFIAHPFVRVSAEERADSERMLTRVILESARVGVRVVVVPLLEAAAVQTSFEMSSVRSSLDEALDLASRLSVKVAVEADLPANELKSLMDLDPHPSFGVCYDTGNAAASGFDITADLTVLRSHVSLVHIKDRDRSGISVQLGTGLADFPGFFRAAAESQYAGRVVLETPRGGDSVEAAGANLKFLREQAAAAETACLESRAGR